jgi:Polysaccharide pyruvyl transferase
MGVKFAQMVCARSDNIGDDIQSIAAACRLPKVDLCIDRERLDAVEGPDPVCTIMNAWFMHTNHWPPSEFLRPIFVGFHVRPGSQGLIARHVQYLKPFEPIGTRDKGTAEFLNSLGVRAEVTYCLSLTFPSRMKAPANGKVIIVDANDISIPRAFRRNAVRLSHVVATVRDATKLQYARDLLEFYRDTASLIITTRLHCALPCIGMSIPVVFFGNPADYRTRIVSDIGGTIYRKALFANVVGRTVGKLFDLVEWSPKPLDVSPVRERLLHALSTRIDAILGPAA